MKRLFLIFLVIGGIAAIFALAAGAASTNDVRIVDSNGTYYVQCNNTNVPAWQTVLVTTNYAVATNAVGHFHK